MAIIPDGQAGFGYFRKINLKSTKRSIQRNGRWCKGGTICLNWASQSCIWHYQPSSNLGDTMPKSTFPRDTNHETPDVRDHRHWSFPGRQFHYHNFSRIATSFQDWVSHQKGFHRISAHVITQPQLVGGGAVSRMVGIAAMKVAVVW